MSRYQEMINNLKDGIEGKDDIDLLTKISSEPNYFDIKDLKEYYDKKDKICYGIINNVEDEELKNNPYLVQMTQEERLKFAISKKKYGISLEQASQLVSKFGTDIDTIGNEFKENKELITDIKSIYVAENIEDLQIHIEKIKESENYLTLNSNLVERELKDAYDKEYQEKLYIPNKEDELKKYLL